MNKNLLILYFLSFVFSACAKDLENIDTFNYPYLVEDEAVDVFSNTSSSDSLLKPNLLKSKVPSAGEINQNDITQDPINNPEKKVALQINEKAQKKGSPSFLNASKTKATVSKNDTQTTLKTEQETINRTYGSSQNKTQKIPENLNPNAPERAIADSLTTKAIVINDIEKAFFPMLGSNKQKSLTDNALDIRILKKSEVYQTNSNYTLLVELLNKGNAIDDMDLDVTMPKDWKVISVSKIGTLGKGQKKLCMISFYIPGNSPSGTVKSKGVVTRNNAVFQSFDFELNVANNYALEVFNIQVPQQLQAGEVIETKVGIKNNGNVNQKIQLKSRNTINGESVIIIPKDSTVIVQLSQKTDPKANAFRKVGTNLEVFSQSSGKTYYNAQSVEVIPTKIKQKDPYFRYPMKTSMYFSSHTRGNEHYSTMSAELKGNGYLDVDKDHHLNFTIRAPKKENLKRFSIVDQYSLIYRYKDKMTLYLGDHSYYLNRLGFGSRYGMGYKLDYNVKKWTFSTFYSKPRLYDFSRNPVYGAQIRYYESDSLSLGLTLEKSEGNSYNYNYLLNQNGKGQIATLDYKYRNDNTYVDAEVSSSFNSESIDYATNLNVIQNFKKMTFASYLLLAGKDYLGNISNSLQLTNSLYYNSGGLNFGLGHAFSKVNKRLDPTLFETEPYYENYFATLGYRISNKHYVNFRFDKRVREDQLEPRDYYYKEYGFNYNFNYTDKLFTGSFGGRLAKTQNILSETKSYRNTYAHHLNLSYKIFGNFNIRGGLNHIYTNRYGYNDISSNYFRYNLGFNFNLNRRFRLNGNYNSGFSLEESYKKRDYVNMNLIAQINRHHRVEVRANYFENPNTLNHKELFAYAKYTYSFGVGVKRVLEQGGVTGTIVVNNGAINVRGIKLFTAGKTIVTNVNGNFELNNLKVGTNYIFVDDASLPLNVLLAVKNPIKVIVEENQKAFVSIPLLKSGTMNGHLNLKNKSNVIESNMEAYVKLENKDFTYYTEANKDGKFKFTGIVPGNYTFNIIRFKTNGGQFKVMENIEVAIKEEDITTLNVLVQGKERKIKFKNTNFNVAIKQ